MWLGNNFFVGDKLGENWINYQNYPTPIFGGLTAPKKKKK